MNTEKYINKLSDTLKQINGFICYKDEYSENKIIVNGFSVEGVNDFKSFPLPKKQIDLTWLLNKCEKVGEKAEYTNLRSVFEKLEIKGDIYYTSFGFSYDCFMKSQKQFDLDTNKIKQALSKLDIKYTNEFSEAWWVYRFKISKSKENIDKINNI